MFLLAALTAVLSKQRCERRCERVWEETWLHTEREYKLTLSQDAQLEEIKTFMQDQRKANKDLQSKLDAMEHTIAHLQQVNRLGILEQSALLYPEQARFLLKHLLRSASSEKAPFAKVSPC